MLSDSLGNPVRLQAADSLGPLNDFVEGFISCEARAANVLSLAERDKSAIVQACCAALHMFAEAPGAPSLARPFILTALANIASASRREQLFVTAIVSWVDGDIARAIQVLEQQVREFPRDLVALKLGQYHLFNRGDAAGLLRLALGALPHAGDVSYLHGMAAFGWEQCHLLEQAEAAARRAIGMCRKEPWAQHALAHVMLTQGRLAEGLAFMRESSDCWSGLNSFMVTHNWWHLALFALDLGQHEEVLRLYDQQVWGVVKEYTQDQVGAVSLLARLELAGVDVGERWQDVADYLVARTDEHVLPFLDLQYLYGLSRAGRPEAATLMHNLQAHCASDAGSDSNDVWRQVCLPAAQGMQAHAEGDYARAAQELGVALPRMLEIGGSHAQRDLFEQIHFDALMHSGRWSAAQQALQPRLRAQPESLRLKRHAQRVYAALGLPELAPQACDADALRVCVE